jgi:hypothetical protein
MGGKNSLNYQNLTNLAEIEFSQAKEMSVAKEKERGKWDVVNSRYCQECDRSWAGSDPSKVPIKVPN